MPGWSPVSMPVSAAEPLQVKEQSGQGEDTTYDRRAKLTVCGVTNRVLS